MASLSMAMRVFSAIVLLGTSVHVRSMRMPIGVETGKSDPVEGMTNMGDMLVPDNLYRQWMSPTMLRKVITADSSKWPEEEIGTPTVPFIFSNNALVYREKIENGMKHWEQHTCIRFREATVNDRSYINFVKEPGCWSYVGRIDSGNGQKVSIGSGCDSVGIIIHEIGHAVGFIHEQMRADRDSYLVINWDNIEQNNHQNFDKVSSANYFSYNAEYDYTSVMQYGSLDFTSNGKVTMATASVEHQGLLGRGEVLSHRDKLAINRHYGCIGNWAATCSANSRYISCVNGGYLDGDCTCVCPPNTSGDRCETLTGNYYDKSIPACSQLITEEITITSPNYPSFIPIGTWCVYQIQAPEGKKAELAFESFNLEKYSSSFPARCLISFLEIREEEGYEGSVYCGSDVENRSFFSKNQTLTVYLDVPYSYTSLGFKAQVRFHNENNTKNDDNGASVREATWLFMILSCIALLFLR